MSRRKRCSRYGSASAPIPSCRDPLLPASATLVPLRCPPDRCATRPGPAAPGALRRVKPEINRPGSSGSCFRNSLTSSGPLRSGRTTSVKLRPRWPSVRPSVHPLPGVAHRELDEQVVVSHIALQRSHHFHLLGVHELLPVAPLVNEIDSLKFFEGLVSEEIQHCGVRRDHSSVGGQLDDGHGRVFDDISHHARDITKEKTPPSCGAGA